jgi:hypothetical protein
MKKIYILLVIEATLWTSCQKADEYLKDDASKPNYLKGSSLENKPNAEVSECKIRQVSYQIATRNDVLQFTYNSSGNPVTIKRLLGAHTGYPNFVFKYNEKDMMTELIGTYETNTVAEFWHKYFYDNKDNIVVDSAYIFPRIENGFPENSYIQQATYFTYDNKRRIIKDSTAFSGSTPPVVHTYTYDADGNKTGSIYDDKININRTNKIWMFLNKDYSINNPFKADSYNTFGLPVNFNLNTAERSVVFLGTGFHNAQISYDCNGK